MNSRSVVYVPMYVPIYTVACGTAAITDLPLEERMSMTENQRDATLPKHQKCGYCRRRLPRDAEECPRCGAPVE